MKIGEVEVKRIPFGEDIRCQGGIPGKALVYFNGTPYCAECFGTEILEGQNGRELIGYFCAKLVEEEPPAIREEPRATDGDFQVRVVR